jgi:hypothetical protein
VWASPRCSAVAEGWSARPQVRQISTQFEFGLVDARDFGIFVLFDSQNDKLCRGRHLPHSFVKPMVSSSNSRVDI